MKRLLREFVGGVGIGLRLMFGLAILTGLGLPFAAFAELPLWFAPPLGGLVIYLASKW